MGRRTLRNMQLEYVSLGDGCQQWLTPSNMNVQNSTAVRQKFFRKSCIGFFKMPPFEILEASDTPQYQDTAAQRLNEAISKRILEHRDFIYEKYLELPIVF